MCLNQYDDNFELLKSQVTSKIESLILKNQNVNMSELKIKSCYFTEITEGVRSYRNIPLQRALTYEYRGPMCL